MAADHRQTSNGMAYGSMRRHPVEPAPIPSFGQESAGQQSQPYQSEIIPPFMSDTRASCCRCVDSPGMHELHSATACGIDVSMNDEPSTVQALLNRAEKLVCGDDVRQSDIELAHVLALIALTKSVARQQHDCLGGTGLTHAFKAKSII